MPISEQPVRSLKSDIRHENTERVENFQVLKSEGYIQAEEVGIFSFSKNGSIEFTNPYKNDLVNFLQICIENNGKTLDYSEKNIWPQ